MNTPHHSSPTTSASGTARTVLSIGTFDGVHLGHQALMRRAREVARSDGGGSGARVVAMVFEPNPLEVLRPGAAPARLTTFERRREHLLEAGADEVVRIEPTRELLALGPEEFIDRCVDQRRPIAFVEGHDFHFGRGRAGDVGVLAELGKTRGFGVEVVQSVEVALTDHQYVPARSTMVRWLLSNGRVRDAAVVLGRAYEIDGRVVSGDRRGRTIGYPTANIQTACMLPADGVYAARAEVEDGRVFSAAVSIGTKPTFGEHARTIEAFLLIPGATRDAAKWTPIARLPEYGWTIRLQMLAWVREQIRYNGLPPLLEQMERDCARIAGICADESVTVPAFDHRAEPKEAIA